MNGIEIKKKSLNAQQVKRLQHITYIESDVPSFAKKSGVSEASIRKARYKFELSEQIIDKIIKAL